MAVDTASRRFSLIGFGCPVPAMVNVPDVADPTLARRDLVYLYTGITLDAPAAAVIAFLTMARLVVRAQLGATVDADARMAGSVDGRAQMGGQVEANE